MENTKLMLADEDAKREVKRLEKIYNTYFDETNKWLSENAPDYVVDCIKYTSLNLVAQGELKKKNDKLLNYQSAMIMFMTVAMIVMMVFS